MKPYKFYPSRDIQILKNIAPECKVFIVGKHDPAYEMAGQLNKFDIVPCVYETIEDMLAEETQLIEDKRGEKGL